MNFSCSALFHMKTKVFLKYFVRDFIWKTFLASKLSQIPSNLVFLKIFLTLMSLTQFQIRCRATKLQKFVVICLT